MIRRGGPHRSRGSVRKWREALEPGRANRSGNWTARAQCRATPTLRLPYQRREGRFGRVEGCARMRHTAHCAGTVMGALPIGLTGLVQRGGRTAGADRRRMERVGGSDAGRPAGTDRCKDLHREGHQDDGKKIPQPPAHQKPPLRRSELIMWEVRSREQVPGDDALHRTIRPLTQTILMQRNELVSGCCEPPTAPDPTLLPKTRTPAVRCNHEWRNTNHFAECSNFEQSLLKLMTKRKRWSTSELSGWPQRHKSGGPSLGRNPGAHKQRRPVNQDQIHICGEIGSTQFSEQGFAPCSFFRDSFS